MTRTMTLPFPDARMPKALILSAALLLGLAACDESVVAMLSSGIDTLGSGFKAAFNASATSEPVDPDTVNLVLTPTLDPFNP